MRPWLPPLLLGAGLAACAGRGPGVDPHLSPLDRARANYAGLEDLSGLVNVIIEDEGESERLGGTVVFQRPSSLRLEVMTPLGQAVATIVHEEGLLTAHDHREDRWWQGELAPDRSVRAFGVLFSLDAWVESLRDGGIPFAGEVEDLPGGTAEQWRLRQGARVVDLRLQGDVATQRLLWQGGELVEEASYDEFRRSGGVLHPNEIQLRWPQEDRSVQIKFRKKAINRGVDAHSFTLAVPPGVAPLPLEDSAHVQ